MFANFMSLQNFEVIHSAAQTSSPVHGKRAPPPVLAAASVATFSELPHGQLGCLGPNVLY